ncbi:MAG TPA: PfkB family carbohydrate kinase, partial [Anaerolineaceae bacterium]|nr:PfkB family carbohydrate kinase [Anaerolineaceae bacterium]
GANWQLSIDHVKEALDTIRRADLLILQLDIPNETIEFCADFAQRNGVAVMLNPAPPRALSSSLLANARYLVMNEAEASVITETTVRSAKSLTEAAERLHAQGVAVVIISLGEEGAFYSTPAESGRVPAFPVHTIDTTGAGDAFVGALAVATGNGRPILEAVRFASAAAALATKKRGGRPSLPYLSELEEFLIQADV